MSSLSAVCFAAVVGVCGLGEGSGICRVCEEVGLGGFLHEGLWRDIIVEGGFKGSLGPSIAYCVVIVNFMVLSTFEETKVARIGFLSNVFTIVPPKRTAQKDTGEK